MENVAQTGPSLHGKYAGLTLNKDNPASAPSIMKALLVPNPYWPESVLHEDIVPVRVRNKQLFHIAHPDLANAVLTDAGGQFRKHAVYRKIAGGESGPRSMIATQENDQWEAKLVYGPQFNNRQSLTYVTMMETIAQRTANQWDYSKPVEIAAEMASITFEIIWRVLFGGQDPDEPVPAFVTDNIQKIYQARIHNQHRKVVNLIWDTAAQSMAIRAACPHMPQTAFLNHARDPAGNPLDPETQQDNLRLFLSAGHKTSASTAAWVLSLLADNPAVASAVQEEVDHLPDDGNADLVALARESMLAAVVNEALRLYPPAIMTVREAVQDIRLGGMDIPEGSPVVVNIYALHRHRGLWDDPDFFRPERFQECAAERIVPGAFRPFSAGAHVCLGMRFAMIELLAILRALLRSYEFAPGPLPPKPTYSFALHAWDGVDLHVRPRS